MKFFGSNRIFNGSFGSISTELVFHRCIYFRMQNIDDDKDRVTHVRFNKKINFIFFQKIMSIELR